MIGIDEVGRGAWAGPLVVAGCISSANLGFILGLNDSKKLTRRQRLALVEHIRKDCQFAIGVVEVAFIDEYGLSAALRAATLQVVAQLPQCEKIILDGSVNFLKNTEHEARVTTVIKADANYPSVMAASIIAKVYRDDLMTKLAVTYPRYGFERHVGYGTTEHKEALQKYGVLSVHRMSFRPVKELTQHSSKMHNSI